MGLEEAHRQAAAIIGTGAEDFAVAAEVERLRHRWRPRGVRVVLLAESHVWTSVEELWSRVTQPDGVTTGYARFVYCLGYGERSLVQPGVPYNRGTRQYWELLHHAVFGPATENRIPGERDATVRALRKLLLLHELRAAGIWLVDASVTALVRAGGARLASGRAYREVLQACWREYVRDVIAGCRPNAVLIVGKMVHDVIGEDVRKLVGTCDFIYQPNSRHLDRGGRREQQEQLHRCCSLARAAGRARGGRGDARSRQASATRAQEPAATPNARYRATRLTFKREVIEPLAPDGEFEVETPEGLFRLTKRDFYTAFPNVAASRSYRELGFYNYRKAPRQAAKFLVKAVAGTGAGLQ